MVSMKPLSELTVLPNQAMRVEANTPHSYRVAQYPDGRLVLQGAYAWTEGFSTHGVTWRDIPVVEVDDTGQAL